MDAARGNTLMEGASRTIRLVALGSLAIAALVAGCKSPVGTTSVSMLRKIQESPDPNIRYLAYVKLASPRAYDDEEQKVEAAKVLASRLVSAKEPVASRAEICHTLGELKRPEARPALLRALRDEKPEVRASACRAMGKAGQTEDATVLARIMATDSDRDCQVAAIEGLATLKAADPRIDMVLVDGLEHSDPAIHLASLKALRLISGQDFGPETAPWKKYAEDRAKTAAAPASGAVRR